jgi:hypothetical protein
MTIKHLYPAVEPSLNLDFANSRKLDPRITFTRASTGTYLDPETQLITTAAANEARIEKEGLLIEESRTNLTLHSEDFTNAAWSHGAETLHSANQAVAPDGTTTADLIYPNSTGFGRTISQNYGNANGTYTVSVFAKAGGRNFIYVYNAQGNAKAWFNLSTGAKGSADAGITNYDIIDYGNGWYRCWVSTNSTTTRYFFLGPADADNSTEVTASGTNGIYVWGAQFETGSFPTSYIPTSGSTVTRSADAASITGTNFSSWYNSSAGTVFTKFKSQYPDGEPTTIFEGQAGSTIRIFAFTNYNRVQFQYGSTGVYSNDGASGYPTESDFSSAALFYTDDGASSSFGGSYQGFPVKSGTGTGGVTISSLIFAPFTGASGALQASSAHLFRFTYYPYRLTDAQLEALTL